jgi:hypothetical protein
MSVRYSKSEIERKVYLAIELLSKNDSFLLENGAHERSITHKLAVYLQLQFPEYHVDCEYNLHGVETKRLPRECNGENKDKVFPDIIVHIRGADDNLLVIEVKPHLNHDKCDQIKLELFTAKSERFRYRYGLAIGLSGLAKPCLTWFANGKQIRKRCKF